MTRRAFFEPGSGVMRVAGGRLCFVADGDHSAASLIVGAASDERPLRAVAAVVAGAGFDVPPFVLCVADNSNDRLQGMVFGDITVLVGDSGTRIDGRSVEPWATFDAAVRDLVAVGAHGDQDASATWVIDGQVKAGSFTWQSDAPGLAATPTSEVVAESAVPAPQPDIAAPATSLVPPPAPPAPPVPEPQAPEPQDPEPQQAESEPASPDVPLVPDPVQDVPVPPAGPLPTGTDVGKESMPGGTTVGGLPEAGIQNPDGVGTESVRCNDCQTINDPAVARCVGCGNLLGDHNSERVWIDQPGLGAIHFSNEMIEPLDATLIVGRNPAPNGCDEHERAIVLGQEDLTVSRRHLLVYPNGWKAMVINLKDGHGTMLQRRSGTAVNLAVDTPTELANGDSVLFGGLWLRYSDE